MSAIQVQKIRLAAAISRLDPIKPLAVESDDPGPPPYLAMLLTLGLVFAVYILGLR